MKQQYIMCDEIGVIGSQIASTKRRAEYLYQQKTGERATAYDYSEKLPGFEPVEDPNAWIEADRKAGYII